MISPCISITVCVFITALTGCTGTSDSARECNTNPETCAALADEQNNLGQSEQPDSNQNSDTTQTDGTDSVTTDSDSGSGSGAGSQSTSSTNSASPPTFTFGSLTNVYNESGVGSSSDQKVFQIKAGTTATASFTFSGTLACSGTVPNFAAIDQTAKKITFSPTNANINQTSEFNCYSNDNSILSTSIFYFNLTVKSPGQITIQDGSNHAFGTVAVNSRWRKTLTLENTGGLPVSSIAISNMAEIEFLDNGSYPGTGGTCASDLAAGSTCTVTFQYTPASDATLNETISITHADGSVDFSFTATANTLTAPAPASSVYGAQDWDQYGSCVDGGLDVNHDDIPDYFVGAYYKGNGAGSFYVYSGADDSVLYGGTNGTGGSHLGQSGGLIEDLNGDNYDDFFVGNPFLNAVSNKEGQLKIYSGINGNVLFTISGSENDARLGFASINAGDMNSDTKSDLLIASPFADEGGTDRGRVDLYSGADGSTVLLTISGTEDSSKFGIALDILDDIDGDNVKDIIIAAPNAALGGTSRGRVTVHSGADGSTIYTIDGTLDNVDFGSTVASLGDLNGDGKPEFGIGEGNSTGSSRTTPAHVYDGATGNLLYTISGGTSLLTWGFAGISGVGDTDGDGYRDIVITEVHYDGGSSLNGRIRVFSGGTGNLFYAIDTPTASMQFFTVSHGTGDLNGDGRADFIVGGSSSKNASGTGTARGATHLFYSPAP